MKAKSIILATHLARSLVGRRVLPRRRAAQVNSVPALGNRDAAGASYANIEGQKASYFAGLGGNTPAATPTDIAILTGSSTKTVKVTKVRLTVQAPPRAWWSTDLVKRWAARSRR
jgi:hypothetical protein